MLWNSKWFPGTNLQDINLDWILKKVSALRGGNTGQYLYKKSNKDFDFGWKTGSGGSGGTSDYLELDNKPSINNVELTGNKTAADLGLATPSDIPVVPVQSVNGKTGAVVLDATDVGAGTYSKPVTGIPKTDLSNDVQTSLDRADTALQTVPSTYRTATAQDTIDAEQDTEIAYVINGTQSSVTIPAEKYVIIRNNGTISDGLYITTQSIPANTNITASMLSAIQNGGLNDVRPISLGGTSGSTDEGARFNLKVPYCVVFNMAQNSTLNLAVTGPQLFLLVTIGTNNSTRDGLYLVGKASSDTLAPHITAIRTATDLTVTASPALLTLVNNTGISARIICITYQNGQLPTEAN